MVETTGGFTSAGLAREAEALVLLKQGTGDADNCGSSFGFGSYLTL